MSPVCLSPTELKTMLKIFSEYGAKALMAKNMIHMNTTDSSFGEFQVWVDVWPNFSAALLKWNWTNTPATRIKNYYYDFSLSNESFKEILETPGLVDLYQSEFVAIMEERRPILEAFAEEKGYRLDCNDKFYDIFIVTQDNLVNVPAPQDLIVGTLTPDMAELVAQNWGYTEEDKFDHYKEFVKLLITAYPNVCLYNSIKQPVAYAVGQEYGAIGMLYVDPKYRGRGCAKATMSILSQKYLSENITPFIVVDIKNILSVSLNKRLGYESIQARINWYTPVPKTLAK